MGKQVIHFCDICKSNTEVTEKQIQVIFETEQTEGRSVKPYLSLQKVETCITCLDFILKDNYLHGYGAMGHNTYYFRNKVL